MLATHRKSIGLFHKPRQATQTVVFLSVTTPTTTPKTSTWKSSFIIFQQNTKIRNGDMRFAKRMNKNDAEWIPNKNHRICSEHFVGNKAINHSQHPAYIPTWYPKNENLNRHRLLVSLSTVKTLEQSCNKMNCTVSTRAHIQLRSWLVLHQMATSLSYWIYPMLLVLDRLTATSHVGFSVD